MPSLYPSPKGEVRASQPGEIFVDESNGKLWRVTAYYPEPTVRMEEVEQEIVLTSPNGGIVTDHLGYANAKPRRVLFGGVSGQMWINFRRIWGKEQPAQKSHL